MKSQQIDQKVEFFLKRASSISFHIYGVTNLVDQEIEIAKLIQEEEHHQEQMELIKRLDK